MLEKQCQASAFELNEKIWNLTCTVLKTRDFKLVFEIENLIAAVHQSRSNIDSPVLYMLMYLYWSVLKAEDHSLFPVLGGLCVSKMDELSNQLWTPSHLQRLINDCEEKTEVYYINKVIAMSMYIYTGNDNYKEWAITGDEFNYIFSLLRKNNYCRFQDTAIYCIFLLASYLDCIEGVSIKGFENYTIYISTLIANLTGGSYKDFIERKRSERERSEGELIEQLLEEME